MLPEGAGRPPRCVLCATNAPFQAAFSEFLSGPFIDAFGDPHRDSSHRNLLEPLRPLDGPAIRNANWGDSRESIRANRFAEKRLFS